MIFISLWEIVQLAILTIALGYIFSGFLPRPRLEYEIPTNKWFDWEDIKWAALIAAPAVILHEFGHKFVALAFGLPATFHIWGFGLGLGVILKAIGSPFLFLAPAYVSIPFGAPPLVGALIAFAGPGVNLILWGISSYVLKTRKGMSEKEAVAWAISKKLNLFLFFFNLIPLAPLDGSSVLSNLIAAF
jgi:Zn-dependent protease